MKKVLAILMTVMLIISLAACKKADEHDLGNADRATNFNSNTTKLSDTYGQGKLETNEEFGTVLTGVAVMRLLDFTGDGNPELYVAYSDGTKPYANRQQIYGFDNGPAEIFSDFYADSIEFEEITSKSSADSEAPCIWLYTDKDGLSYLVVGDDLSKSAEYYYIYARISGDNRENREIMELAFTEINGNELEGTYEKIELAGISEEQANEIFAENQKVLESIQSQSDN